MAGPMKPSTQSDDEGELGERVSETGGRLYVGPEIVEAAAKVLNEGMAGDDDPGGAISLQPSHRPEPRLEAPVVGLEPVVGMGLRVMEGRRGQLIEDARIDPVPVGGDLHGRDPGSIDRPGEETACRLSVVQA